MSLPCPRVSAYPTWATVLVAVLLTALPAARAQTTIVPASGSSSFSLSGGRVYYATNSGEICTLQRVRSASVGGGPLSTHLTISGNCPISAGVVKADSSFVFFLLNANAGIGKTWSGGTSPAYTPVMGTTPGFDLAQTFDLQGDWVYWNSPSAVGRVSRDGTTPTQLTHATTFRAGMVALSNGYVYWVEGDDGTGVVKRTDLGAASPTAEVVTNTNLNSPIALTTDGTSVFWGESNGAVKSHGPNPGGLTFVYRSSGAAGYFVRSMVVDATHIYWLESTTAGLGRIMRQPRSGGAAVQVGPGNLANPGSLQQDADQLYWIENPSGNINRIAKNAAAVLPDFSWIGLEATQGIQNIANDVPLVWGKPTLVRGYARSSVAAYPSVTARLFGYRTSTGAPMPARPFVRPSLRRRCRPTPPSPTTAGATSAAPSTGRFPTVGLPMT